ncbi:MAG: YdjY domain-containing protein [Phycisphaerae bacterium]
MPAARTILLAACLGLTLAVSPAAGAAPDAGPAGDGARDREPSKDSQGGYGHLKPLLIEADSVPPRAGTGSGGEGTGDARTAVRVDPEAHAVEVPVRLTGADGVVEWLLSAGGKHPRTSVLAARCPVRALTRALEASGLEAGRPPAPVGDDAARPPDGPAVRLTLRFRGPDGEAKRVPAKDLLAASSDDTPVPDGRWVYVGPQALADGKVLLAELSGSLVTTALRDTSAMVYWVPAATDDGPRYVKAYYARPKAVPAGVTEAVLEIRPAAPRDEPE